MPLEMPDFKVGDRVKLKDYRSLEFPKYKYQIATIIETGAAIRCRWSDGKTSCLSVSGPDCFGAYVIDEEEKPMEQDFKVGDQVIFWGITYCSAAKDGDLVTVTKITTDHVFFESSHTKQKVCNHSKKHFKKITQTNKETIMSESTNKYARVLKDLPAIEAGAILVKRGDAYYATEDFWIKDGVIGENAEYKASAHVVEHAPDFFEPVYEMSKFGKAVFATKEEAKKMVESVFKPKK